MLSRVYSDLDVDPELQMTVQEFVNIEKDLLTSQDLSDVNIIESVISDTSEDSQIDDDDDIEEVQPTCKQVTDSLNIEIKFFEMESSTVVYPLYFLYLSLGQYLSWWTISSLGYHPPSNQCFGTDLIDKI